MTASKLSAARWFAGLTGNLERSGWTRTAVRPSSARLMFYRWVDDLVLSLVIETSSRYVDTTTASYYLAPTFCWPLMGGDVPPSAYARIGTLIHHAEYSDLSLPPPLSPEFVDAWWTEYTPQTLSGLSEAIERSRPRFLQQPNLLALVRASTVLKERLDDVKTIIAESQHRPAEEPPATMKVNRAVPAHWYAAAVRVLGDRGPKDWIKRITEDAWNYQQAEAART